MITYITGGERSGKSAFAEHLYKNINDVCYIATAYYDKNDEEMKDRIKKHREMRNPFWRTFEDYKNLTLAIENEDYYFLDCVTNLVSRIMFDLSFNKDINPDLIKKIEIEAIKELEELIVAVKNQEKNLILVSNEIGMTMIPMDKLGRAFTDILGRVNQRLAKLSDEAYLVVSGIPVKLK